MLYLTKIDLKTKLYSIGITSILAFALITTGILPTVFENMLTQQDCSGGEEMDGIYGGINGTD